MTPEQIEKASADQCFEDNFPEDLACMGKDKNGRYENFVIQNKRDAFIRGWLAAKQESKKQLKVGDIVETESGLFQVMKHPDSIDDRGITTNDINR